MMAHEKIYKTYKHPWKPSLTKHHPKAGYRLSALSPSGKFCIMNTAAGSLESCHQLSFSCCLLLRIFKVKNHYWVPFGQKNTQKSGLASGWILQSKWISSQRIQPVLIVTSRKWTHKKKKQNKATKLNQLSTPKRQSLTKQKREKWGK